PPDISAPSLHDALPISDRLIRMVRDLLDASRIDAYQLSLERTTVDLEALVSEVAARMNPSSDRVIRVRAPGPLPKLYADPGRIEDRKSTRLNSSHVKIS